MTKRQQMIEAREHEDRKFWERLGQHYKLGKLVAWNGLAGADFRLRGVLTTLDGPVADAMAARMEHTANERTRK